MAGGTEDEQGNVARAVGDVLDEVEEILLGPVNVVEDHDKRPAAGDRLEDGPHAPQQLVLAVAARTKSHERPDPHRGVLTLCADERPQLVPRLVLLVIGEDPGRLSESFGDGPEGDALPVGQAPAFQHQGTVVHLADELLDQP